MKKKILALTLVLTQVVYANELKNSVDMIDKSFELGDMVNTISTSDKFKSKFDNDAIKEKIKELSNNKKLWEKNKLLQEKVFEEKQNIVYEDGKINFKSRDFNEPNYDLKTLTSTTKNKSKEVLSPNQIYIFMSSSVPKTTWVNYAKTLHGNKLTNATLLLRGCIGGCEKIRPTLKFFREIIESDEDKKLEANMHIDPMLFRRYNISEAPCVVFAEGIKFKDGSLSQGLKENVEKPGKIYKSCGDWKLSYHLRIISKTSKNKEAEDIYNKLIKAGY